jgi:hypothetical protein
MSADIINLPPPRRPTISLPDGAAHAINMLRYEIGQLKTRKRVKTEPLIGWLGLMAGNSGVPPNNNSERTVVLGFRFPFPGATYRGMAARRFCSGAPRRQYQGEVT